MAWIYLMLAGLFEVGWAIGLKYSDGFTRLYGSLATLVLMALSIFFLAIAQRSLAIGTAYAVFTGIGACGTAILGMILFEEPADVIRILCLLLILAGILGLRFLSPG